MPCTLALIIFLNEFSFTINLKENTPEPLIIIQKGFASELILVLKKLIN